MKKINRIAYVVFATLFSVATIVGTSVAAYQQQYTVAFIIFLFLGGFGRIFWKRADSYK